MKIITQNNKRKIIITQKDLLEFVKKAEIDGEWGNPYATDYSDPIRDNRGKLIITPEMKAITNKWDETLQNVYMNAFDSYFEQTSGDADVDSFKVQYAKENAIDMIKMYLEDRKQSTEQSSKAGDATSMKLLKGIEQIFLKNKKDYTPSEINYNMENKTCTFLCAVPHQKSGSSMWQCHASFDNNLKPFNIEFMSILAGGNEPIIQ